MTVHFLSPTGCVLPMETRPLVCRLHPCQYNEQGIQSGLSPGCPWALLPAGHSPHDAVSMTIADAERWHRQLYDELRLEPTWETAASESTGAPALVGDRAVLKSLE